MGSVSVAVRPYNGTRDRSCTGTAPRSAGDNRFLEAAARWEAPSSSTIGHRDVVRSRPGRLHRPGRLVPGGGHHHRAGAAAYPRRRRDVWSRYVVGVRHHRLLQPGFHSRRARTHGGLRRASAMVGLHQRVSVHDQHPHGPGGHHRRGGTPGGTVCPLGGTTPRTRGHSRSKAPATGVVPRSHRSECATVVG